MTSGPGMGAGEAANGLDVAGAQSESPAASESLAKRGIKIDRGLRPPKSSVATTTDKN